MASTTISCVDFWGKVTATVELAKGMRFNQCVTGAPIWIEEILDSSCIVRLQSGNLFEISHSQLEKWKYVDESVTSKTRIDESVTGQSVTSKARIDESVKLSPVRLCAACGKQCSQRAKTCSPACRKRLSRMKAE